MIVSLFLPKRLGSYYPLAHRIVSIEITKQSVHATVIVLKGRSRTIENVLTERFQGAERFDEQVVVALKNLKMKLGSYHEIYGIIPSSYAIFKELTLPFIGAKKVKIVIPFEVEPQLPFNLADGVVDGIIIGTNEEAQKTNVLVTAMKRDSIARYEKYFEDAELPLNKLSIGILELYSLYETIPGQANATIALVEMGTFETTIGLITNGQLKYVRTLQKGIHIPKVNHQENVFDKQMQEQVSSLFDEIKLTTDIALQKVAPGSSLSKIVLTGAVTDIQDQGVKEHATRSLACPTELLDPKKLIQEQVVSSKIPAISGIYMPSIAAGCASEKTESFNLLQEKEQEKENKQVTYQLYTIGALAITLLATFTGYSFLRTRALKKSYKASELEAIDELKRQFKLRATQTQRLDIANKAAQAELRKQESAWKRISAENRYAYVTYLAELTKCINMQESQLQLDTLIIKDDTIKIYGSVPGYQQLTRLQDQLECPIFKKVQKLQAFNFKSEPITLVINPEAINEHA